jgi:hypothetical protein
MRARALILGLVAAALGAVLLAPASGSGSVPGGLRARPAPPNYSAAACKMLGEDPTLTGYVFHGHSGYHRSSRNICEVGSCWEYTTIDGQRKCKYGRGATLTINVESTEKIAKNVVRHALHSGYDPVNIPADLAGIQNDGDTGAKVVFAVGRAVALFNLGAASDLTPHPHAPYVRAKAEDKAVWIAKSLRNDGCPQNPRKC